MINHHTSFYFFSLAYLSAACFPWHSSYTMTNRQYRPHQCFPPHSWFRHQCLRRWVRCYRCGNGWAVWTCWGIGLICWRIGCVCFGWAIATVNAMNGGRFSLSWPRLRISFISMTLSWHSLVSSARFSPCCSRSPFTLPSCTNRSQSPSCILPAPSAPWTASSKKYSPACLQTLATCSSSGTSKTQLADPDTGFTLESTSSSPWSSGTSPACCSPCININHTRIPCHGKNPCTKYSKTYPTASKSSLRLCSMPKCALIDAYLAVPVKFLFSLYGMCWCVFGSRYFFDRPKSIKWMMWLFFDSPTKKFYGLMSLWM